MEEHFKVHLTTEQIKEDKVTITKKETLMAIKHLAKGKASATDNISDTIFTKKT